MKRLTTFLKGADPATRKGEREMTTTMVQKTLALLEHDEADRASALLEGALKRNGLTRAQLRDALESGYGKVLEGEHPTIWTSPTTPREQAVQVVARLLSRLRRECGLPLEAQAGASAMSVLREMLA